MIQHYYWYIFYNFQKCSHDGTDNMFCGFVLTCEDNVDMLTQCWSVMWNMLKCWWVVLTCWPGHLWPCWHWEPGPGGRGQGSGATQGTSPSSSCQDMSTPTPRPSSAHRWGDIQWFILQINRPIWIWNNFIDWSLLFIKLQFAIVSW